MDKETLSNYGWIVVCVMILAVLLALASPFGTFVADGIKSTTQGLFDVNRSALNATGLINIEDNSIYRVDYHIIEGAGQTVILNDGEARFRSDAEYSKFVEVKIDGVVIDESNYTTAEGSTIINLKESYLATLAVGEHELSVVSEDGHADCIFNVDVRTFDALFAQDGTVLKTWEDLVAEGKVTVEGDALTGIYIEEGYRLLVPGTIKRFSVIDNYGPADKFGFKVLEFENGLEIVDCHLNNLHDKGVERIIFPDTVTKFDATRHYQTDYSYWGGNFVHCEIVLVFKGIEYDFTGYIWDNWEAFSLLPEAYYECYGKGQGLHESDYCCGREMCYLNIGPINFS